MCGIAGFIVKDPSSSIDREKLLDALLLGIDDRGGDATGFVARNREGLLEWHKASCDARDFIPYRRPVPVYADVVIAHTRWATQGSPAFPENNHPIKRGPIFVTHNGVIFNDRELFRETARVPYGQVDSEAIAALLADVGTLDKKVGPRLGDIDGSAAIVALDERDGTVLLARISSSPLYVLGTRRIIIWASTAKACEQAHKKVIGSLGRARAMAMAEGDAIVYRDGKGSTFSFEPPMWSYVTKKATPIGNEASGSYLPSHAARPEAKSLTTFKRADECEICGHEMADPYDLWDADDVYEVCETCFGDYAELATQTYAERLSSDRWGEE